MKAPPFQKTEPDHRGSVSRLLLISNATGLDLTANQGRRTMLKDKHFIQKIDELTPLVYLETMAKFMDYDA